MGTAKPTFDKAPLAFAMLALLSLAPLAGAASSVSIDCPLFNRENPFFLRAYYLKDGAYSCQALAVSVRNPQGQFNSVPFSACRDGSQLFRVQFEGEGSYSFYASAPEASTTCTVTYVLSQPSRKLPELSPWAPFLIALLAAGFIRRQAASRF